MEQKIKVVLLGDTATGKTSILQRFTVNKFDSSKHPTTVPGMVAKSIRLKDHSKSVRLQIWDTAGQERFHSLAESYYKDADAAILIFDMTNKESLESIKNWIFELNQKCQKKILKALVGNKIDLNSEINQKDAKNYEDEIDAQMFFSSAKENYNITEIFEYIESNLYEEEIQNDSIVLNATKGKSKKCC